MPRELQAHPDSVAVITGQGPRDATGVTGDIPSAAVCRELKVAAIAPDGGVREGEKIQFAVEADKIHIFDPETEQAVL